MTIRKQAVAAVTLALGLTTAAGARAQQTEPAVVTDQTAAPAPPPAPPPAPYSLPWQLRPVTIATVLRSDTSMASYEGNGQDGSTVASMFLASYKLTPSLAPMIRFGVVRNQEPGPMLGSGTAFVNPLVGVTWGRKLGSDFRLAVFGATSIPIGMGGSKSPAMDETAAAVSKAILARSAMDNAMFAVNYLTPLAGVGMAWVAHKMTVQVEATVLQLFRVRNEMFAPESTRTNFTSGLHVGGFVAKWLSLGGELRYQRWLSTPNSVKMAPVTRDNVTIAVGPRFHVPLGGTRFIRPGLSYSRGLDKPLNDRKYHILQLDVPVAF